MDIENLIFDKNSFDAVCLSNSLHHMSDIDAVITTMTEMLVANGILVFNEMYSGSLNQQQVTHTLIHHFIAEIDCINNLVHNETLSYKEVIKTIKGHSKIGEVDIWKLEIKDQKPLNKEACNSLKQTLAKTLKSIESHKDYLKFEARALQLEKRLDTIGFLSAPQMIVVAKLMTY
jgi:ubiquinone/menaquinone biosynthesis C-methylase UbiE